MAPDAGEVLAHLHGRQVAGIYPLLADETCWLLAIDLDGDSWPQDVAALRCACEEVGLRPAVERSRSGAGAHVWFFFTSAVPASSARALGELRLTRAMQRSSTLRMDSYDRLFPSQDTLPAGGFGNLIALPLQHAARESGNTLFLDDDMEPYADQWAFLASAPRILAGQLEELVADARSEGKALDLTRADLDMRAPWKPARPLRARLRDVVLPATVTVTLAQRLYIERDGLPTVLIDALRRLAVFANPMFAERQAMRLSTGQTPRLITCFEDLPLHIALPRGTLDGARSLLGELGIELVLTDERSSGSALRASFTGELSSEQTRADALARRAAHGSSRVLKGDPLRAPRPTRGGEALEWS